LEIGKTIDEKIRYKWGRCIAQLVNELLYNSRLCDDKDARIAAKEFVNTHTDLLDYLGH
jgi:hypothetical protein